MIFEQDKLQTRENAVCWKEKTFGFEEKLPALRSWLSVNLEEDAERNA